MDYGDHVDVVERELDELVGSLRAGPMSAAVPTCPGWAVRDLTRHVADFCGFWSHALCEGTGRPKPSFAPPSDDAELAAWLAELGARAVEELRATPAETDVWTWWEPDQSARFVARRMANELAVHRYDAQAARGTARPIEPPALATDGIDEILDVLAPWRQRSGEASGQTLHLHGTDDDGGAEWLVTLHPDRIEVARAHATGDLALRGAVSDLALVLVGRPSLGPIERFGDDAVLDAWHRVFVF